MYDYYVMFTTVQRSQDIFQTLILSNTVQLLIFKLAKKTTKHNIILTYFVFLTGACDLYTWGSGLRGMLGHKDEDNEKLPRVVESLLGRDISMVACGVAHTMALSGKSVVERNKIDIILYNDMEAHVC